MATDVASLFWKMIHYLGQKFHRVFTQIMTRYKEIHNNLTKNKKPPLITQFFKKILGLTNVKIN
jgi:hypothetical protein